MNSYQFNNINRGMLAIIGAYQRKKNNIIMINKSNQKKEVEIQELIRLKDDISTMEDNQLEKYGYVSKSKVENINQAFNQAIINIQELIIQKEINIKKLDQQINSKKGRFQL